MGFIERLRQADTTKVLRDEQLRVQQEERQATRVVDEARKALAECERHTKRREQAENYRKESGVSIKVDELAEYLASRSGLVDREKIAYTPKDPDSVVDQIKWGSELRQSVEHHTGGYSSIHGPSSWLKEVGWRDQKSIAVETCPDGTIVFHAGCGASSTIRLKKWRSPERDQLFEKALEKAFRNPGITSTRLQERFQGQTNNLFR